MQCNPRKIHVAPIITSHISAVFLILTLISGGLYGQQDFRGSIEGRITDSTGGVIPGVTVTVTLDSQNKTHSAVTNDAGIYTFSYLDPGTYGLKAVMPGFKTYERPGMVLQVSDKLTADITLTVGDVSQEVIVRGNTTPLVQQVPNYDQAVDEKQIEDLPLNGRNSYQLFGLAAGVLPEGDPSRLRPFDNEATSDFTVGGTGNRTTEVSLDGGTNVTGSGRVVFIPSTEAIQEFKVTTSTFDASVGNSTGAIINASIKSGTGTLRGSLYEYHRNSALDANFWNANREGQPLPSAKWNQFGGTLGGPLRLPFRPHAKDRTFFFINYEGMRQNRVDAPFVRTVPTDLERQGDFSQTYYATSSGEIKPITIYDPLTTHCVRNCAPDPAHPERRLAPVYQRDPFPNNIIPPNRLNPVALQLLQFIPMPNRLGGSRGGRAERDNFIRSGAEIDVYDQFIARIDHSFSDRQNLFVNLSFSGRNNILPNWLGNAASPNQGLGDRYTRRVVVDDTYTFASGLVLNAQYALARYVDFYRQASVGVDLSAAGFTTEYINKIKQSFIAKDGNTAFPDIDISNYIRLGVAGDNVKTNIANDAHELRLNFTKLIGKHGLRWGFDGRVIRRNEYNFGLPVGRLSFGKAFTHGPNPSAAQRVDDGNEFATFLLGYPTGGYIEQRSTFALQDLYTGAFIQDDFKVSGRLTINAGVRWEYWLPRTERYNRMTRGFDYDAESPLAAAVRSNVQAILSNPDNQLSSDVRDILSQLNVKGGLVFAGRDGAPRGQLNSKPFLFAPRFGLAYRLSDKTVLRGGIGIYFEPLTRVGNPPQDGFNARTNYISTTTTDQTGPRPASSLSNPFPENLVQPSGASLGMLTGIGQNISFVNPDRTAPRVLRAEFGIQRELPGRIGINANYLTTRWRGRPIDLNINEIPDSYLAYGGDFLSQAVSNPFNGVPGVPANSDIGRNSTIALNQLLKPYPQFNNVTTSFNRGYGWYNGFNLNVSRRFERGFLFQAAYTVSKGMTATTYANPDDRRINKLDRRLLDDDRPQRLVVNGVWELPLGGSRRFLNSGWPSKILGGWQVSGISIMMRGRPIHFGDNRDYAVSTGADPQLPNGPYFDAKLDRWVWFNRDAFRVRHTNELRNVPRNLPTVRSQGINTIDLRLTRNFPIRERVRMQFIVETFNLTNRVQFAAPETDIRNVNFGTTASQANLPRSYQFALRLQF